uniref:C-type lectin domain family 14 member A n=1 Tax=Euleptes europaea TaxID=460621 RepID=UPI00253F9697|nr:C-type lectin domain family 14 member A [Euleptes europaea]
MRGLLLASLVLLQPLWAPGLPGEAGPSGRAWCQASGACYSVHVASRTFSGAQEACALRGGALSTASGEAEIQAVVALLRGAAGGAGPAAFWLGLARRPPQCTSQELPLRGFSWSPAEPPQSGANATPAAPPWLKEPSLSCTTEKCAGLQAAAGGPGRPPWGLKERSCAKPSAGYVCKYRYPGTCPAPPPGAARLRYTLPSRLQSAELAFSPPGTVLSLRCLAGEARLTCRASPDGYRWEGAGRGLCSCPGGYWSPGEQRCVDGAACLGAPGALLCVCAWGFRLAADERSCLPAEGTAAPEPPGLVTATAGGPLPSSPPGDGSSSRAPWAPGEANRSAPAAEAASQSTHYVFLLVTLAVVLLVILVMASLQVFRSCLGLCSCKGGPAGKGLAPSAAPEGDLEASATRTSSERSLGPSKAESAEASEPVAGQAPLEEPEGDWGGSPETAA